MMNRSLTGSVLSSMLLVVVWAPPSRAEEPIAWRTDYNAARREAEEKGLPLFIEVGTDACFYCRKLEAGPFRDPAIAKHLEKNFIPLKIDANREPTLARALKVTLYPTMVLAGADGKIHAFLEGYMESQRIEGHIAQVMTATSEAYARELQDATLAAAIADYPRAVELLKLTIATATERTLATKAKEALQPLEKKAAVRLARARELEETANFDDLTDALAGVASTFRGTRAAADAEEMLMGIGDIPDRRNTEFAAARIRRAQDLLSLARSEFKLTKYHLCLQHCDELTTLFPDSPESREAASLSLEIQTDPERLAIADAQLRERTAAMQLALAESWARKGQSAEAAACLERVVKLCPVSRLADEAKARLASLGNAAEAYPTGFRKP